MLLKCGLEVYGIIYKITNKINGKVYIGQTIQKGGFDRRYCHDLSKNTHNEHLRMSIKKYGIDNFYINKEFDVAFSREELDIKEILWIKYYNSTNEKYGYNISLGGHIELSESTKQKIGESNSKKIICYNTKEIFNSITEASKIKNISPSNLGYCVNGKYDSCYKNKDGEPLYWCYYDDYLKGWKPTISKKDRRVYCVTTGEFFKDAKEVKEKYGIDVSHLYDVCSGKRGFCGIVNNKKMQWLYYRDYLNGKKVEDIIDTRIYCVNNKKVYNNISEIVEEFNIDKSAVYKCCNKKRKSCGVDKYGNKLIWEWYRNVKVVI